MLGLRWRCRAVASGNSVRLIYKMVAPRGRGRTEPLLLTDLWEVADGNDRGGREGCEWPLSPPTGCATGGFVPTFS